MALWEHFEIQCTEYLNNRFGTYAKFIHQGGSDSTSPDIFVKTKSGQSFYIDVKLSPAQCGQFVLLPDIKSKTFIYSNKNINRINQYALKIMSHMNNHFDEYREAGTAGKEIIIENGASIFSDWIIQTYLEKGTHFFITNDYTIIPIQHFYEYFDVSAKYRIKRSGSSNVGNKNIITVLNYVLSLDYKITNSYSREDKLYVTSPKNLHNKRFILDKYEYMFSQRNCEYEIRKLSNTYNANVIFSIKKNNIKSGISDSDFIIFLN